MKKIKVDRYLVHEKGRTYEVLRFPFVKHMWAIEIHKDEGGTEVTGCEEAFSWLRYAFAILAEYPDKIIYFPCKQEGIGDYYIPNYNLVLCRPELQFKRHLWPRIKRKLDRYHWAGKFALKYDRKKLDSYYEKGLWTWCEMEKSYRYGVSIPDYILEKAYKRQTIEIRGNTMFMVLERILYYDWHYTTAKDLDDYHSGDNCPYIWSAIGWIIPDGTIRAMYREAEV